MLDRQVFGEFYRFLETAHGWRTASEKALDLYHAKIAAGMDDESYMGLASKLLDSDDLRTPQRFLSAIRGEIRKNASQSSQCSIPDAPCNSYGTDAFIKFARAMRALEQLKANFPDWRCPQRQDESWFHDLWRQPLSEDDRLYVEGRQVERIMEMGGLAMQRPSGQSSDLEAVL